MGDVLNYEVVAKVVNAQPLQYWLAMEGVNQYVSERTGETVRFKFARLDDAFRFRMRFDEVLIAA